MMEKTMGIRPILVSAVIFFLHILLLRPSAAFLFDAPVNKATGSPEDCIPGKAVSGNVNLDGFLDLLVLNGPVEICGECLNWPWLQNCDLGGDGVRVLLGRPQGAPHPTHAVSGVDPRDLATGDFNGDGYTDMVFTEGEYERTNCYGTTYPVGGGVKVLLGNGDGSFTASAYLENGNSPHFVVSGDLDDDGVPDLAVANDAGNDITLYTGNGDGTFTEANSLAIDGLPGGMEIGDVDTNDALDLVVTAPENGLAHIFLGHGDGTFSSATLPTGDAPGSVKLADLDFDGNPDLITVNAYNMITVFLGLGDGTFPSALTYPIEGSISSLDVGDLTADGYPDIIAGGVNGAGVLAGNGDGTFAASTTVLAGSIQWALAEEMNGDPHMDLVTICGLNHPAIGGFANVRILLGTADGLSTPAPTFSTGSGPKSMSLADFNRDSIPDAAVVNSYDDTLTILQGMGEGMFLTAGVYATGSTPVQIEAEDLDSDGSLDLVVINLYSDEVSIHKGSGSGTFFDALFLPVGERPSGVATGDINEDGFPDLVVANADDDSLSVMIGRGDGTFFSQTEYPTGNHPLAVASGDLDQDGHLDVAVVTSYSDQVWIHPGNGDGTLGAASRYKVWNNPIDVDIADLNTDGILDLAVTHWGDWYLSQPYSQLIVSYGRFGVMLGHGDGSFAQPSYTSMEPIFFAYQLLADLNGNGLPDMAVADTGGVSVFSSVGNGTFEFVDHFVAANSAGFVGADDVDSDGDLDLAVINKNAGYISVLKNTSHEACMDLDGDGYGNPASSLCAVSAWDCDDTDPERNTGSVEQCDNDKDDDCDGYADDSDPDCPCQDADGDGYGVPGNIACGHAFTDCNDSDPEIHPNHPELCDDLDNDCNRTVDDIDLDRDLHMADSCGGDDCDDGNGSIHPDALESCNGTDDDCDGIVDNVDLDEDGYLDEECSGDDCDDSDPDVNPGQEEVPDNERDDDCDGKIDEPCSTVPGLKDTSSRKTKLFSQCFWLAPLGMILYWKIAHRRKPQGQGSGCNSGSNKDGMGRIHGGIVIRLL